MLLKHPKFLTYWLSCVKSGLYWNVAMFLCKHHRKWWYKKYFRKGSPLSLYLMKYLTCQAPSGQDQDLFDFIEEGGIVGTVGHLITGRFVVCGPCCRCILGQDLVPVSVRLCMNEWVFSWCNVLWVCGWKNT